MVLPYHVAIWCRPHNLQSPHQAQVFLSMAPLTSSLHEYRSMHGESQRTSGDMSLQLASLHEYRSMSGKVSRQRVACCSPFASLLRDINQRTGATCISSANTCVIIRGENVEVGWVRLAVPHPTLDRRRPAWSGHPLAGGQCVRVMQGSVASLYDLAWSPDGTQVASSGTDTLVTIWDVAGGRGGRQPGCCAAIAGMSTAWHGVLR